MIHPAAQVAKPAGRSWRSWLWPFRAEGPDGGEAIEAVYSKPWCDIDIPQQENVPPAVGCGHGRIWSAAEDAGVLLFRCQGFLARSFWVTSTVNTVEH